MYRQSSISNKLLFALCNLPKSFKPTPNPKLFMTLLVKNEADILEQNIIFHKHMGVDGFIITDNNSSDSTPDIIEKYRTLGWIKEVITERGDDYKQKVWVDRMIWLAKIKFGAEWIINADADELWYAPSGSLKDELTDTNANVLICDIANVYPEEDKPFTEWDKIIHPVDNPSIYDLSPYSVFNKQRGKVIHRTDGYLQISMGNHKVKMIPQNIEKSKILIYHYSVKGKSQFMSKMINGGEQLEKNPKKHGGRHWRYFYDLYKKGVLEKEYNRVIGKKHFQTLQENGFITTDKTITSLFNILKKGL